jgi:hypothetical protein
MKTRGVTTLQIIVVKADASIMDAVRCMLRNRTGGHPDHSDHALSGRQRPRVRKGGQRDLLSGQALRS